MVTVPANAAVRNAGRSPSSRARFTHADAAFGVMRPNDSNHVFAVRHASNWDRSRASKAPTTPATTAASWWKAVNNAGNAERTDSSDTSRGSTRVNPDSASCNCCNGPESVVLTFEHNQPGPTKTKTKRGVSNAPLWTIRKCDHRAMPATGERAGAKPSLAIRSAPPPKTVTRAMPVAAVPATSSQYRLTACACTLAIAVPSVEYRRQPGVTMQTRSRPERNRRGYRRSAVTKRQL